MNQPHIIRIRGPWFRHLDSSELSNKGAAESPHRVEMPSGWTDDLGAEFRGSVRYERHFNKPTGLTPSTRLHLVFEQIVGYATVRMNGETLGNIPWPSERQSFDVAGKLQPRNLLSLEIRSITEDDRERLTSENKPIPEGGLVGEVRLEIG